jgi:DNA-binding PadR family transcriptional regulator
MNTLGYVLLSLLAREPMSGYDLTISLKKHFDPFWPISHTQIYPTLVQLEEQGLSSHHIVEQYAMRPNKKVHEITEEGRIALRQWVESPTSPVISRDEFFLKTYSLWLADPERMKAMFHEQIQFHEERLALHEQALQEKRSAGVVSQGNNDFFGLMELLFEYTMGYEQNYITWCQSALRYLEQREHIHKQEE